MEDEGKDIVITPQVQFDYLHDRLGELEALLRTTLHYLYRLTARIEQRDLEEVRAEVNELLDKERQEQSDDFNAAFLRYASEGSEAEDEEGGD